MRVAVPRRLKEIPAGRLGPHRVVRVSPMDGTKLYLENDNWALVRFSGTEPVLRLSVEADSEQKASELAELLRQFVRG
jgi:phosphomannomutase